jgi:hypothetical protein
MLSGARNAPQAINADGKIVLVGGRDWGGLTMFEQMQVVLAAKNYQNVRLFTSPCFQEAG